MKNRQPYRSTNLAELCFTILCDKSKIEYTKRGYADFSIIVNDEIIGFVEVKPSTNKKLKLEQLRFKRFCERYKIPCVKWTPIQKELPEFIRNI